MALVYIGLGGNLGDVRATFRSALSDLRARGLWAVRTSSMYRNKALVDPACPPTEAVPDYWNAVVEGRTALEPRALLDVMHDVERRHGRDRQGGAKRWASRTLDLDLLLYEQRQQNAAGVRLPHPGMGERLFVLRPLVEVSPQVVIPGLGPAAQVLAGFADRSAGIEEICAW